MSLADIKILHLKSQPTLGDLANTVQERVSRFPDSMRAPVRRILITFVAELMLLDAERRNWYALTGSTK